MKTGAIVYVVGDGPERSSADVKTSVKKLGIKADSVEVVSKNSGHFDVHDAWRSLIVKGMQRVLVIMAEYDHTHKLIFTGRKMRLCG